MHQAFCQIVPLDRFNWERCLEIEMKPEQRAYIPSILYSLAQARFENLNPYGVMHKGSMVGFMMYGNFSGICWISRIIIDQSYQEKGIGRAALMQLLEMLKNKSRCREIRTSYTEDNHTADAFFKALGFEPLPDAMGGEVVARYEY